MLVASTKSRQSVTPSIETPVWRLTPGQSLVLSARCCLLDRQAGLGEPLLDPGQRRRCKGSALQAARQLGDSAVGGVDRASRRSRARGFRSRSTMRVIWSAQYAATLLPARGAASCAAQVLDQRQAQHDRNRPESPSQRRHHLVGRDEAAEAFRVDLAVAVRDDFERDVMRAAACGAAGAQAARSAYPRRAARGAHLLLDQVEVVDGLARRGDQLVRLDRPVSTRTSRPERLFWARRVWSIAGWCRACAAASVAPCCSIWSAVNSPSAAVLAAGALGADAASGKRQARQHPRCAS